MKDTVPAEVMRRVDETMEKAWRATGHAVVDATRCDSCENHWHITIFPAVREIVGGKHDGEQHYAKFSVRINKLIRMFDSPPKVFFDTAQSVPHIIAIGIIEGHNCDVSIMCCPPTNLLPTERAYATGPKKGTIEVVAPQEEE